MKWFSLLRLAAIPAAVYGTASTDFLQDTDPAQSGYLPNHNISPAVASTFVLNWKKAFGSTELFYAKPLVWTPPGATSEQVIAVSNLNNIFLMDGLTGTVLNQRTLDPPFSAVDTGGCGDVQNFVGIIGTPIIDPATDIMYLFSKGYKGGVVGPAGTLQGQYKFYAIQLPGLTNVFPPVIIDGHFADNDPTRYFVGGTVMNRPGLAMLGNTIIGGFGGHCDNFNYTGMLVGVSKTAGVGVTSIIAMEASPGAPVPQPLDYTVQMGGKAGIWQSGFGISADVANNRIFFVTGNGAGGNGDNGGGLPANGNNPISTLQQATADFSVSPSGVFAQKDYFEPYEYASLNGGDMDFGSSGAALLDPYFSGGGVSQVVVAGGKSGKIYIMDANNLGGFATGPGGSDGVLQTISSLKNRLLSGIASYPAEGGYIYYCPTAQAGAGAYLYAYKFTPGANGQPFFTLAGQSALQFAGVGAPTVTSMNGKAGSAIVWMTDVNNGLVAYNAIPVGGVLTPVTTYSVGRLQKYQRPAFGNARVYTTETNQIYGIGASQTPALVCAATAGFGSVVAGLTKSVNVKCTAGQTALTLNGCSTNLAVFSCSGVPATIAAGAAFTMAVTFNLTSAAIEAARTVNSIDVVPGAVAGSLQVTNPTSNIPYASVALTGTVTASGGYIDLSAVQLDFGGTTVGTPVTKTLTITNDGAGVLTFTSFAFRNSYSSPYQNVVTPANPVVVGSGFTSTTGFPAVGGTIASKGSITVTFTFTPTAVGSSSTLLTFYAGTNWQEVMLVGSASACTGSCSTATSSTQISTSSSQVATSSSILASSSTKLSSSSSTSSSVLSSSSVISTLSSIVSSSSVVSSSIFSSSVPSTSSFVVSSSISSSLSSSSIFSSSSVPSTSSVVVSSSISSSTLSSSSVASSSSLSSSSAAASSPTSSSISPTSSSLIVSSSAPGIIQLTSSLGATSSSLTSSSSKSSSVLSSSSKLLSSSSSSSSFSTSTVGPSSNIATTTSKSPSTFITSTTSSSVVATATPSGYAYMGCYSDILVAHALPLLLANNSITPQVCESLVSSLAAKPTPTVYPFYYVEYHRECYAGSSFAFGTQAVTSLYGRNACTDLCSGSVGATSTGTAFCGGSRQFDLYATKSSVPFVVATTMSK